MFWGCVYGSNGCKRCSFRLITQDIETIRGRDRGRTAHSEREGKSSWATAAACSATTSAEAKRATSSSSMSAPSCWMTSSSTSTVRTSTGVVQSRAKWYGSPQRKHPRRVGFRARARSMSIGTAGGSGGAAVLWAGPAVLDELFKGFATLNNCGVGRTRPETTLEAAFARSSDSYWRYAWRRQAG